MNAITEFFRKIVQDNWIPKAATDPKYKMNEHVGVALAALLALVDETPIKE